ncbi:hypothetical protein [Dongia deserti]|uniref:hypothetical protein n=1 Tax=Dongia deserti TaxID=2268030 RepID=UPI000E648F7B|nr:hypothetical protein [Dongia deserti]
MKFARNLLAAALLVAATILAPITQLAEAATPNVTPGAGQVVVIPLHISGQYTANTTAVARLTLPFPAAVLGVSASARASGGTSPTLTVDVLEGGVTILSAPVAVTAGAVAEATVTDTNLADEAAITVNLAIGGTSPTWNDIVVLVTLFRK